MYRNLMSEVKVIRGNTYSKNFKKTNCNEE